MNNKIYKYSLLVLFILCLIASHFTNKSLAVSCNSAISYVTNENGSYKLSYYCKDVNTNNKYKISIDDAINIFYESPYQQYYIDGSMKYFYRENTISKDNYLNGLEAESADERTLEYGESGIRVHSTQEFKNKIDDLYSNYKLGEFYFVWSKRETINMQEVYNYLRDKYGVTDINRNYYRYDHKGEFEPYRKVLSSSDINQIQESGIFIFDTKPYIYISKEEKNHAVQFTNKLIPLILNGANTTAEKVYRVADYLNGTAPYTHDGENSISIYSYRSIYDLLISRKAVCVGYSIAFSYIMDQLGIESYIVDQITSVNQSTGDFSSVHTYNIVKIDGKFYKVDVTGGSGIYAGTSAGLSSNSFNLSTSGISTNGFQSVWRNNNSVNNLYNQYKSGVSSNYKFYSPSDQRPNRNYGTKNVNGTLMEENQNITTIQLNNPPITDTESTSIYNITNEQGEIVESHVIEEAKTSVINITNESGDVIGTSISVLPVTKIINITNESGEVVGSTMISYQPKTQIINVTNEQGEVVGTSIGLVQGEEEILPQTNDKLITNIVLISLAASMVVILIILRIKNMNKVKFSYTQPIVPVKTPLPPNNDPYEELLSQINNNTDNNTTITNNGISITNVDTSTNNNENKPI